MLHQDLLNRYFKNPGDQSDVGDSQFTPLVNRLGCLRGIGPLTGFATVVEITDWHRFTGNTIDSFLGLVPTEYPSGPSRQLGGITKTGNSHARRLLAEAAWHHRRDYQPNATSVMQARWEKPPSARGSAARPATNGCTTNG